jgi:hypothetical protein
MKKEQIHAKINYLEEQLVSLNHFLPETYEYLMAELDAQRRLLAEIDVKEAFKRIEALQNQTPVLTLGQDN